MKLIRPSEFIHNYQVNEEWSQYLVEARRTMYDPPTMSDLVKAVNDHLYVGFYYEEEEGDEVLPGFRLVEPYVVGKGYVAPGSGQLIHPDRVYLRAFIIKSTQTDRNNRLSSINRKSVSKSNRRPYFRLFRLDRMKSFQVFRKRVPKKPRYRYNPDDKMIHEILAAYRP